MTTASIEATSLHKKYGRVPVLDGLSLTVEPGEVFCLLGPNGTGVSTLVHLLLGFLRPYAGEVRALGFAFLLTPLVLFPATLGYRLGVERDHVTGWPAFVGGQALLAAALLAIALAAFRRRELILR